MVFVACGLNHKTAPVHVREKVVLSPDKYETLLCKLVDSSAVNEAVLLSTCNRTEIYCETSHPEAAITWLAQEHQLAPEILSPYCYLHHGYHGVRHLLRVASGLDSMMLGEPQILGQMKEAYRQASQLGTVNKKLRQVFEYVFKSSKRIRTQSGIGSNPVSIAYGAVQLIERHAGKTKSLRVLLIGSGETATLVAKYLHKQHVGTFFVASRTQENAAKLAETFNGNPIAITDIARYLPEADIVISATACPLPFINQGQVSDALKKRSGLPMFFLDLAVPRDIETNVGELDHVTLYNIDDLQTMIQHGMEERRTAAVLAEQLLENELNTYIHWHRSLSANNIICDYRSHMRNLADIELQQAMTKLGRGEKPENVLQEFSTRLLNKLTHAPTVGLKQVAWDGRDDLFTLMNYLYNLPQAHSNHEEIN